ncbi:putative kinase [Diaminobutyricimonas aerilata]|uniref:Putative kinase n=1 Tax=Diaminobutyricimonas aerilata TaxID=1162967 RepID=A0A2M9CKA7_9MICO|nr:ATP-binding protein [Diaminobutyricimonas aerilata]PJJ72333.1 putative kinase [Diaminobutyricimonas aerilata]
MSGAARPETVIVLVGAPAAGKTTLREQLVASGAVRDVVSPDDERAALREADVAAGRAPKPLQEYSLLAMRANAAAAERLLSAGRGYLADATHLRRRDRVAHVRAAREAGLPAIAVLMPDVPIEALRARNAARPELRRVPEDTLARHAHRRGLLSAALLREEGFDDVIEVAPLLESLSA